MESLYAKYIKERENFEIIESEFGFATYFISGVECYLRDLYVLPERRKSILAYKLATQVSEIAKDRGCKYLTGTVYPATNGASESLAVFLRYGLKVASTTNDKIILMKEL